MRKGTRRPSKTAARERPESCLCKALMADAIHTLALPVRVESRRGQPLRILTHPETKYTLAWLRNPDYGQLTLNDVACVLDLDVGYIQKRVEEKILSVRRDGLERLRASGLRCRPRALRRRGRKSRRGALTLFVEVPGLQERIDALVDGKGPHGTRSDARRTQNEDKEGGEGGEGPWDL